MPTNILLIDDDATFGEQVIGLLQKKGFTADQCHDGKKGLHSAIHANFDLILLDVLLPSLNGFSVLKQLRQVKQTPVMMLTACGAESERIQGYQKGADDYLAKPCNFTEMLLRIEAVLRRVRSTEKSDQSNTAMVIDQLQIQKTGQRVKYDGQIVEFTPIQFRLLWTLVENHQQILTKPYLYQAVLKRAFSRYDRSLDMHLSRIRRKLSEVGMPQERFVTIHGKGYKFS
ncbi:MAG: two-component system response regulator PfeR [Candidatus Endobugula sp.]|jgi:two-component system response regulator PfeR